MAPWQSLHTRRRKSRHCPQCHGKRGLYQILHSACSSRYACRLAWHLCQGLSLRHRRKPTPDPGRCMAPDILRYPLAQLHPTHVHPGGCTPRRVGCMAGCDPLRGGCICHASPCESGWILHSLAQLQPSSPRISRTSDTTIHQRREGTQPSRYPSQRRPTLRPLRDAPHRYGRSLHPPKG